MSTLELVKWLLLVCFSGADVNEANSGGWTALMYAAYIGHERLCRLLLDSGAATESANRKQRTALMLAASCGNDQTVRLLLEVTSSFCSSLTE